MGKSKAKAHKSAPGKGKNKHSKAGASVKLGKVNLNLNKISRNDFIKGAGIALGSMGLASIGVSSVVQAEYPPGFPEECKIPAPVVPDYINDPGYGPAYVFSTLAALVDTFVPGKKGVPPQIPIFVADPVTGIKLDPNGAPIIVNLMDNLGAEGTETPGAVFIPPSQSGDFVPPSYPFLYMFLPNLGFDPQPVDGGGQTSLTNLLIYALDNFSKQILQNPALVFKDLDYDTRYQIVYLMDKPDMELPQFGNKSLIELMIQGLIEEIYAIAEENPDCDPPPIELATQIATQIALQQTAQAKQLITQSMFLNYYIYMSELCNIIPDPQTHEYKRNDDTSWNIIPLGAWDQIGYPGPNYKNPSYTSDYDGLKVTIADGKVKFIQ